MKQNVFTIKESATMYGLVVVLFYLSSYFFQSRFGLLGIPLGQFFGLLLPTILAVIVLGKNPKQVFFLNGNVPIRQYVIGLGLWILALVISGIYVTYFSGYLPEETELFEAFDYIFSTVSLTNQLIMIVVIPAIVEELLFRGLFLSSFLRNTNPFTAIALTSFMFAAMHFSLVKLFTTFILGCAFGIMVYRTKSIYPAIFLHFVNNAISVLGINVLQGIDVDPMISLQVNTLVFPSIVLIGTLVSLRKQNQTKRSGRHKNEK